LPPKAIEQMNMLYSNDPNNRIKNMVKQVKHNKQNLSDLKDYLTKLDIIRNTNHKEIFGYLYD